MTMNEKDPQNVAVGQRIKALMKAHDLSAEQAASISGAKGPTFRRWMRGEASADVQALARLARNMNVSLEWLATGSGEEAMPPPVASPSLRGQTAVPVYDGKLTAGDGGLVFEGAPAEHFMLPTGFLRSVGNPEKMHIVPVQGDSMAPEINHGDWAIIDASQRRATENVFAFNLEDYAVVKRLRLLGNGEAQLVSVNPSYQPIDVRLDREHLIVGRVVFTLRRVG